VSVENGRTGADGAVVLIATGSYPNWPAGIARDPTRLYDSDSVLEMDRIPRSLVVVGAGVIGCEYATIFRALGVQVTLVCGQERLLPSSITRSPTGSRRRSGCSA